MVRRLFLIFIFGKCISAGAQSFPHLLVEHITIREGLSSNHVRAVAEDKRGFIWIGTNNGLNRYDGYRIKTYYHDETDTNSIAGGSVAALLCDRKGRLWISARGGVSCFLPEENRFISYTVVKQPPWQLKNTLDTHVYEDEQGVIWLLNHENMIFRVQEDMHLAPVDISAPGQRVIFYKRIIRDREGTEWGIGPAAIYRLNKITKKPVAVFDFSNQSIQVEALCQDINGKYWVGTRGQGVFWFTPDHTALKQVHQLPTGAYLNIVNWNYHERSYLLLTESNKGMYLLDPVTFAFQQYASNPADPASIAGRLYESMMIDRQNNPWIVSDRGVNKVNASAGLVKVMPVTEPGFADYDGSRRRPVFGFYEDQEMIWLSKRWVGNFMYDKQLKPQMHYTSMYPLSSTIINEDAIASEYYRRGASLFMTTDGGLVEYDMENRSSRNYFPSQFSAIADLRTICPLDEKRLLIRSYSGGLFVFDTKEKKFTRHYSNGDTCDSCLPRFLNYVMKTRKGDVYVTSERGLYRYDEETDRFSAVLPLNESVYPTRGYNLDGFDEAPDGKLWIASKAGMVVYDPETNRVVQLYSQQGRMGELYRVVFDRQQHVWANGHGGIWCYLPVQDQWLCFNEKNGLPGSSFQGVLRLRENGSVVAGLDGAIALFDPTALDKKIILPPAIITEAAVGKERFMYSLLAQHNKQLIVPPGETSFSVDFTIPAYDRLTGINYYYRLEPGMNEFQQNGTGHINFNGLSPGHYRLYVRGTDERGSVNSREDMIHIYIRPRWYQTLTFKAGCVLALIGLIFFIFHLRVQGVRKRERLKAQLTRQLAEMEMKALRSQMNPHFIFNTLNSINSFIVDKDIHKANDYLTKFARLIRLILDHSRRNTIPLGKELEMLQLYLMMENIRLNDSFDVDIRMGEDVVPADIQVPPMLLQPFAENAIWHGLVHAAHRGCLSINIERMADDMIHISITDNGVGREAAAALKSKYHHRSESYGLQITQERIKLHHRGNDVAVTDLQHSDGTPAGTKVVLSLKMEYYTE